MSEAERVRDLMIATHPAHADLITARDAVVEQWCSEHGKTKDGLSNKDIQAIRELPEWRNPQVQS